jgi:hypothetical protein
MMNGKVGKEYEITKMDLNTAHLAEVNSTKISPQEKDIVWDQIEEFDFCSFTSPTTTAKQTPPLPLFPPSIAEPIRPKKRISEPKPKQEKDKDKDKPNTKRRKVRFYSPLPLHFLSPSPLLFGQFPFFL